MQTVSERCRRRAPSGGRPMGGRRLADTYQGLPEGVSKAMLLDRFERAAPRLGFGDGVVRLIRALVRVTFEQDWTGARARSPGRPTTPFARNCSARAPSSRA
jgi:replication initiation protein RepC